MTVTLDELRPRMLAAADNLAEKLVEPPSMEGVDFGPSSPRWKGQSLAKGAAGVVILHGVRAASGRGDARRTRAWLEATTRDELDASSGAGLWFGLPAAAFALAAGATDLYPRLAARADASVREIVREKLDAAHYRMHQRRRPSLAEFDVVKGLSGIGAYLLFTGADEHLREVLSYLVRLTEPIDADDELGTKVPGWWSLDSPTVNPAPNLRSGHANNGMAHGITGPLSLLALVKRRNITVPRQDEAMDRMCDWLDQSEQQHRGASWWPEWVTTAGTTTGSLAQTKPARPSWCYGTPGIARALQLAGIALADPTRKKKAEHALVACLDDPMQTGRLTDPTICHGLAGTALTTWLATRDSQNPILSNHVARLVERLLASADEPLPESGLCEGTAGVALTLYTIATDTRHDWARCLLIA